MANKKYDSDIMHNLASMLISGQASPEDIAARKARIKTIKTDSGGFAGYDWGNSNPTDEMLTGVENTANKYATMQDISDGVSFPQLGGLALESIKEHPIKSMGLAANTFGNLGGLTDNDKFGGQIAGLGLGGLGAALAGDVLGPYGKIMLTMGGGNLGALFDKLRARKEQEQQYYGGR